VILITGGTGFLGSTLIKQLINAGIDVVAIKREQSIIPKDLKSSSLIRWINADINNYFELSDAMVGITQVYHCAATISYTKKDIAQLHKVNVEGTAQLVNICLDRQIRLLHVSSIAALGQNDGTKPVNEQDKWEYEPQMSKYSLSKYEGEMEVWRGIVEGLDAVIVNPSLIIGAHAPAHGTGAITQLVLKGMKYYPIGSVGIVDVEDVAKLMIILMNKPEISGQRYIINHINISHLDLLTALADQFQKPAPYIKASPQILKWAAKAAAVQAFFTNSKPALTAETAQSASKKLAYSNDKIVALTQFRFKPLSQTIEEISLSYNQHK